MRFSINPNNSDMERLHLDMVRSRGLGKILLGITGKQRNWLAIIIKFVMRLLELVKAEKKIS